MTRKAASLPIAHAPTSEESWTGSCRKLAIFMATYETPFLETKLFLPIASPFHQHDSSKEQPASLPGPVVGSRAKWTSEAFAQRFGRGMYRDSNFSL